MTFWFTRLFAAHLLADFVFQFAAVYRLKIRGSLGLLLHVAIVVATTGVILAFFVPLLPLSDFGLALLVIALTHFGLDRTKEWLRVRGSYAGLVGFLGDQLSHTAVLLVVSAWLPAPKPQASENLTGWTAFLMNDVYWWLLCGAILVTYLIGFTLFYLEGQPMLSGSPVIGRYSGFLERLAIFGIAALGPLLSFLLIPLISIFQGMYLTRIRRVPLPSWKSLLLGPALAMLIGLVIRPFLAST